MELVEGHIAKVSIKDWNGKKFYSVKLVNQDPYYGFGMFAPKAKEGDKVTFDAEVNEKGYWQAKGGSLKVVAKSAEEVVQGAAVAAVQGKSQEERGFWAKKEIREVRNDELREIGASRNTAIEWINTLIKVEALKLPAKQADKEAAMNALLDDTVAKFRGLKQAVSDPVPTKAAPAASVGPSEEEVPWN